MSFEYNGKKYTMINPAKGAGHVYEKHVKPRVESTNKIKTSAIPVGLNNDFPCPKCNVTLNLTPAVNAATCLHLSPY
jgi:hypothetical protein